MKCAVGFCWHEGGGSRVLLAIAICLLVELPILFLMLKAVVGQWRRLSAEHRNGTGLAARQSDERASDALRDGPDRENAPAGQAGALRRDGGGR